jgi:hypothetical protein
MLNLFWDLRQNYEIATARSSADQSAHQAERARDAVRQLEERVNKLALVNMALWTLLKENTQLTDEDLNQRVQEIDLSDGKLDGKVRGGVTNCPRCERTLSQKHNRCLYCGYQPEGQTAFDAVAR